MKQFIQTDKGFTETLDEHTCEILEKLGLIRKDGPPEPAVIGTREVEQRSMTQYWKAAR